MKKKMTIRKNAKKYRQFTKERDLYRLMQTPLPKEKEENVSTIRSNP